MTAEDEPASPLGSLVVQARAEGYGEGGKITPLHGYYYRILEAQVRTRATAPTPTSRTGR